MGWGKGAAKAEVKREKAEDEAQEARQPPAKAAKAVAPRKRAASEEAEEAVAAPAPAKKRAVAAEASVGASHEPLARALAPKADAPAVAYTTVVDADEVDALVTALCKAHTATLGEARSRPCFLTLRLG